MAVDEAVLEKVASGEAQPTLRVYGWRGRWLSIGMAEPIGDVDLAAARATGTGVLRRPSGGTAVLHVDQVGWSLALPTGHPLAPGDIVESYRRHGELTIRALERLGIDARPATVAEARAPLPDPVLQIACFGGLAPHEVVVGDPLRKLVGWGQVRRRGVVLHHAVVALRFDPAALPALLATDRARLAAALDARVTGLREAAGREITAEELQAELVEALATEGYVPAPGELTRDERMRADELAREKYAADAWTARR